MQDDYSRALLVIDVQNDFCAGGALEVPEGDEVISEINRLMDTFTVVVATQDWHPSDHASFASNHAGRTPFESVELAYGDQVLWPDHCVMDSHGARLHDHLRRDRLEMIIRKGFRSNIDSYSAFFENDRTTPTGLDGYLRTREVSTVWLVGLATDYCVYYSALDAIRLGYGVVVVENACRGIDADGSLAAARHDMREQGVSLVTR